MRFLVPLVAVEDLVDSTRWFVDFLVILGPLKFDQNLRTSARTSFEQLFTV